MSNSVILKHHDDCKGKYQSHEIYLWSSPFDKPLVREIVSGYGETRDEAYEVLKKNLQDAIDFLTCVMKDIDNLPQVEVDCVGEPV